jgi:hypothetical protein
MPSFVIDMNYFEDRHNIEGEYVLAIRSKREIGANHCEGQVRSCTQFGNNDYSSVVVLLPHHKPISTIRAFQGTVKLIFASACVRETEAHNQKVHIPRERGKHLT